MGEEAKSGTLVKQKGRALVKSRGNGEPKTTADGPPCYGAQHRHEDALWEGCVTLFGYARTELTRNRWK